MIRSLETRAVGPARHMRLNFAERLNIVTGDNGLGKSFLLDALWWALTRSWRGEIALPRRQYADEARISAAFDGKSGIARTNGRFEPKMQAWKATAGKPPMPGLVLYAAADGGFAVWDPLRNHRASRYASEFLDVPFQRSYIFGRDALWNGLRTADDTAVLCNGLIADWVAWQRDKDARFTRLTSVLRLLSDDREPLRPGRPERVKIGDSRDFPTLHMPYGTVPVIHSSAGVQRVISLAYLLIWSWYEHEQVARMLGEPTTHSVIFLFDELEAHLHPRWQRTLLPSLLQVVHELSGAAKVQLIGATHSALMCASVEASVESGRDRLFTLDLLDQNRHADVVLSEVPWKLRGSVDVWLQSELFDLPSARSLEAERAISEASAVARNPSRTDSQVKRTAERLARVIPPTDPFWSRWEFAVSPHRVPEQ